MNFGEIYQMDRVCHGEQLIKFKGVDLTGIFFSLPFVGQRHFCNVGLQWSQCKRGYTGCEHQKSK